MSGKIPPRSGSRPGGGPSSRPSARTEPARRSEFEGEDPPATKKRSVEPDRPGFLDYLVDYKELALGLVVAMIGYGTYLYFQPYFAAKEAAKQRPVISAQASNGVAPPPSGDLREISTSDAAPVARSTPATVSPVSVAISSVSPGGQPVPVRKIESIQAVPVASRPLVSSIPSPPPKQDERLEPGKIRRPGF